MKFLFTFGFKLLSQSSRSSMDYRGVNLCGSHVMVICSGDRYFQKSFQMTHVLMLNDSFNDFCNVEGRSCGQTLPSY